MSSKMNKDFEKLPEIAKILKDLHHTIIWFGGDGLYHTSFNLTDEVCFLNGALYAYQEQQKIINNERKLINSILLELHVAYVSDENSSVKMVYDKIQELLK